ncbi:cytochrome protein [Penicillium pulvis]|uniref:cytochrome protein n=1 Tax=Penicillium pulvis TaxID=1562058 RepID=UPI0025470C29|nr:cytochrome protein [Penicillium pulvis]KAJ5786778.1 cytochrome protein [Penicillium pulvis]
MVAQVTGRVFLGDDTCRDPIWLNMNITYTDQVVKTAKKIRLWPKFLLPVVGKFLPASRRLQRTLQECEDFLQPLISQRKTSNEPRPQLNAIDWFEELSKGQSYNPTISILKISLVSLDTTSELLFHVIRELSTNESLVNDLRSEILTVFPGREIDLDEGFNQQDLKKLKLLDSAIKESQRRSHRMITLRRFATEDVTLDDGTRIPKGTQVAVAATHVRDTSVYEDGDTFNGYRFLNAGAPLVVPTPNHMGFGYGKQACPGRFFVSVEMKILLCKMLLNYDFSMDGLDEPKTVISGYNIVPNPQAKIAIRHRAKATCVTYQEN